LPTKLNKGQQPLKKHILILITCLLSLFSTTTGHAEVIDRVVAVVNDEIITLLELEEKAAQILKQLPKDQADGALMDTKKNELLAQVLPQLIDEHLAQEEIKKLHIEVSDQEVDDYIQRFAQMNNLTVEELKKRMTAEGINEKSYRDEMRKQIERHKLINSQVRSKIVVTDEEVLAYWKENNPQTSAAKGASIYLQHICIPYTPETKQEAKAQAENAWKELKKGKTFEEVAQTWSMVPSKTEGGDLGAFTHQELAPFIKEAIAGLKPGDYSKVIDTPAGFQIFRIKPVKADAMAELPSDIPKEQIKEILFRQKINKRFEDWMRELRSKATIRILL